MKSEIKQRIAQLNNGEIPNGYVKTEFGVFPDDWVKDKSFGDLFNFHGGLGKSRDELGEEGHAYLHYGDMHRGTFNSVSHIQYEMLPKYEVALKGDESYLMEDGDIAFLDASEDLEGTSRSVLIDNPDNKPFIAGLHVIYAKSKGNELDKWFKQYITLNESVKKQFQKLSVGFKVYGVNRDTLPRIKFSYPSNVIEQTKISEILMNWDEAVELQQQYLNVLQVRKKYLIRELFTPENDWNRVKLGDIAEMYAGGTPSTKKPEYWGGNIPWIQSGLVQNNYIDIGNIDGRITEQGLKKSSTAWIKNNSVLVAITGATCANVAYLKCDATANQSVISITTSSANTLFLFFLLQNARNELLSLQNGSAQGGLTLKYLQNFDILLPDLAEQNRIANILLCVDTEIDLQKENIFKLKEQRNALQQYLLNGIVRV